VTGTTLSDEYARVADALAMSRDELAAIAINAFRRAFAPPGLVAPELAAASEAWAAWRDGDAIIG